MAFLGQFLVKELVKLAVEEVVEAAVVVGATASAGYVGYRAIEATADLMSSSISTPIRVSSSASSGFYLGEKKTIYDWWLNGVTTEEYEKLKGWGYDVQTECFTLEEVKSIIRCEEKVGQPPTNEPGWEEKYEPPKDWDGKKKRPNDKSNKKGYPDKKGRVWVPKDDMHGDAGWEVQVDGGEDHFHVRKDGTVRRHRK